MVPGVNPEEGTNRVMNIVRRAVMAVAAVLLLAGGAVAAVAAPAAATPPNPCPTTSPTVTPTATVPPPLVVQGQQAELSRCGHKPPRAKFTDSCAGTVIVVKHTGRWGVWEVAISAGDFTATHELEPGETATEEFGPTVGLIIVKVNGKKIGRHLWVKPEQGCESPSPSPSPSNTTPTATAPPPPAPGGNAGPELPVTGAALPLTVGLGVLLLVSGAAAVLLARRRRVRYTA